MKEDIEILQSKRKEIIEKKKEEEKVVKEVESVKETVKRMKIELAEETKKSDMILQQQQQHQKLQQQTPSQEEDDEKKIKELQQFIQVLIVTKNDSLENWRRIRNKHSSVVYYRISFNSIG